MSEYTKQAEDFLTAHNLEFRSVLVGDDCPKYCEDNEKGIGDTRTFPRNNHIHGKHYRCTISGKDRGHVSFDYWNSYADEESNFKRKNQTQPYELIQDRIKRTKQPLKTVQAYDLLACITKNDPTTFKNFCSDFGYDEDSRKAFDVYLAVQDEYSKVRRFFTADEMTELEAIN
jgi:hypothetical protein